MSHFDRPAAAKKPQEKSPEEKLKDWAKANPDEYARLMSAAEEVEQTNKEDALNPEHRAESRAELASAIVRNDALLHWISLITEKNILNPHGQHKQDAMRLIAPYRVYGLDSATGEQIMEDARSEVESWYARNKGLSSIKLDRAIERWMNEIGRDNDHLKEKLENYDIAA